jgi:hypothetical protein
MRPGTWILYFYPQGWRERYEEEMVALLEQHDVTLATHFDLLLGALDARLDPSYRSANSLFLFKDERTIAATFLCAYAMFLFSMYNWHHYIPLSLRLTPYYLDMALLATPDSVSPFSFVGSSGLNSSSVLSMSDLLMQMTLLACNLYFIVLFVKQADRAKRKRFLWPAIFCFVLLFAFPLLPLLGVSAPTVALTNPSGTILSVEVRPWDQIVELYMLSFRLLCPLLLLLLSSLFIAVLKMREVMASSRKQWLLLALMVYLILPIGRMLWLSESVQIPSTILPPSSLVLGALLTYFPPFAGLATLVLILASNEGRKSMWRVALFPAIALSLVMFARILLTVVTLPLILRSTLHSFVPWNDGFSIFTLSFMLFVMFLAGGIVLLALLRGFVALKASESYAQSAIDPLPSQSACLIQSDNVAALQSYVVPSTSTLPVSDSSNQWGVQQELEI